ncbi:MAG: tetratricopeptide repeat protein [Candidatus Thorarchaeota archaeon]|nr:MAG: tetratricopeptide repeat protein [Candidatus Thorarchaeota archaeon]
MVSPKDTLNAIEDHLEANPDDASAWNAKGVVLAGMEMFGDALRSFNQAIQLNPKMSEAYVNRGRVLLALGPDKATKALKAFDSALSLSPDDLGILHDKAQALHVLGRSQEELECYKIITESMTDESAVWVRKGDIELELGHFKAAVASYSHALSIDSDLAPALVHQAIALSLQKKWKEAIKSAERAAKIAPDDLEVWRVLADVNLRAERHRSAMKALKKAYEIEPTDASIVNTMGMVEYKAGRLKEAVKHFQSALIRDKKHISALRNLGFTSMELEDWAEARKAWDRLTSIVKDDPDLFDAQATNFARLEDFCSASEAWERARRLYKKRGDSKEAERVTSLGRAARINCSRQKKAARAERERERATRTFSDRFDRRKKKGKQKR